MFEARFRFQVEGRKRRTPRGPMLAALVFFGSGCAAPGPAPSGEATEAPLVRAGVSAEAATAESYLEPNYGAARYAHVTQADMPWRVAIAYPRNVPRYGSRRDARNAAIDGMRLWEAAIRARVPWFELEIVVEDPDAPVQIAWKRRTTGSAQGRAGYLCEPVDGGRRIGGRMEIAIRESPTSRPLTIPEVRLLVAHEFGHLLGLGHCLECDSAMNYAWNTRERIVVTDSDVRTFLDLIEKPDACRGG